jgi:molybdopterin molybdotransferase
MASPPLHTVEEAQAAATALARRMGVERVGLTEALGRVLREKVVARADVPPCDNSAMDGYAVRSGDVRNVPTELLVVGEVAAGQIAPRPLASGEAYSIMTGAPLPPDADAVVMVEKTERAGQRVRILERPAPRANVRSRGEDVASGASLLRPGITLGAAELGVLAAQQRSSIQVARRPQVAILSTGDELRDLDQPLAPGAIAETNGYTLRALVAQAGGQPRLFPVLPDEIASLRTAFEEAAAADLIVTSGGVSVGEHDHVKAVLHSLGASLSLWRVAMKPGKPLALSSLHGVPFFGLPGNPVSSMVSFLLFVRPALRTALGCARPFDLPCAEVRLTTSLSVHGDRRNYLRAVLRFDEDGHLSATPMKHQGSGVLTSMVGCNGLLVVEAGEHCFESGAHCPCLVIAPIHPA